MRILKRPSNSNSPTPLLSSTSETIKEREARYQAARERIFKEENGISNSPSHMARESKAPSPAYDNFVSIIRNPRGPGDYAAADETGNSTRGFGNQCAMSSLAASHDAAQEPPVT